MQRVYQPFVELLFYFMSAWVCWLRLAEPQPGVGVLLHGTRPAKPDNLGFVEILLLLVYGHASMHMINVTIRYEWHAGAAPLRFERHASAAYGVDGMQEPQLGKGCHGL